MEVSKIDDDNYVFTMNKEETQLFIDFWGETTSTQRENTYERFWNTYFEDLHDKMWRCLTFPWRDIGMHNTMKDKVWYDDKGEIK